MGFPGRQAKVESLVDEHYEALYRYAYRLSGTTADAEDLVQEAFCRAQEKLGQLRELERAKAWLFSILRNTYLHRLRLGQSRRPSRATGRLGHGRSRSLPSRLCGGSPPAVWPSCRPS